MARAGKGYLVSGTTYNVVVDTTDGSKGFLNERLRNKMAGLTQDDIAHFLHANDQLLASLNQPELQIISQIPLISNATIDWIEVRPSLHGNGLFATRDIPANRCITLYPTHQIAYKALDDDGEWQVVSQQGEPHYYQENSLTITPIVKISGIPYLIHNLLFVGHMLNDPSPDTTTIFDAPANTEFRHIKDLWTGIFSKRDIQAGEELTICYGEKYWKARV